jgi:hypothetical protein
MRKKNGWQKSRSEYALGMLFIIVLGLTVLLAIFVLRLRLWMRPARLIAVQNRTGSRVTPISFLLVFAMQFLLLATSAFAQGASPDPQRQILGSLISTSEVFVNDSPAPSEVTIFSGDTIRTGETGTAMLTISGNNSLQISRQSQVAFTGDARYIAELKSGMISVKSTGGAAGSVVRAGNFVAVPTNRNEQTVVTIEKVADGSYLVNCSAGNVGILPLQQGAGLILQVGRSARISANGELVAVELSPPGAALPTARNHKVWIYAGLAGGGIAAGVAAAIIASEKHTPVSPSAP